jgi:cytochrome c oxidase subunit 2
MRKAQASLLTVCALLLTVTGLAEQPDGDPLSGVTVDRRWDATALSGTVNPDPLLRFAGGALTLPQNQVDTSEGARIWPHCAFCHTPDGLGFVRFDAPKIAGQEAWYVERQVRNFLARRRGYHPEDIPGRQMAFNAGPLFTDAIIESMAAFVEALPVSPAKLQYYRLAALGPERPYKWDSSFAITTADSPASPERGKQLYATCIACHGEKAQGNRALNSPRLDNKQDWYLIQQLKYFKYGARGTHPDDVYGQQMAAMTASLPNDQAIVDVVAHIMTMAKGPFN